MQRMRVAMLKQQSAMEYLMTYGWAILIIAVVLGALFQLGVFNASSFSPRAPPGSCQVFRPSGPGTVTNINLMGVCTGQLPQYVASFATADSYVQIPTLKNMPSAAITITAWVYVLGGSNYYEIMSSMTGPYTGAFDFATNYNDFQVGNGVASGHAGFSSLTNSQWTFVAGTFDGANIIGYKNGAAGGAPVAFAGPISYANSYCGTLRIGKRCDATANYFSGLMSNVQIYNASLTANQIQALYLEGIGGAPMKLQNLVGWWPLNGNSNDYSGNNNNGVPTSVTFTSQYGK